MNPTTLVDKRLGNSYQVVKEVHDALAEIIFLANNLDAASPKEIELQESDDQQYLQWRYSGGAWTNLVAIKTLAAGLIIPPDTTFGIPDPDGDKAYARLKGSWTEALTVAMLAKAGGVASLGSDGLVPASQLPEIDGNVQADWNATTGPSVIKNKPTIPAAGIPEAPTDNKVYARQKNAWVETLSKALLGAVNGVATLGADGKVPATQLPASTGSDNGSGNTGTGAVALPLKIASGTLFTVPADNQVIFAFPIAVDGTLQLDGYLIEA